MIESTAQNLRRLAGQPVAALLGPCIHPQAYEFGSVELDRLAQVYGTEVIGQTADGQPGLDMTAGVTQALTRCQFLDDVADRTLDTSHNVCTSGEEWFSHRSRGDKGRQATVAWIDR